MSSPAKAHNLLLRILSTPRGLFGATILAVIVTVALLAPVIAPYDPVQIDYLQVAKPPSAEHWLGTDEVGRDILSRLFYGARVSLIVVLTSISIAMIVGSALGLFCGYIGGWVDEVVMRVVDGILSFPTLVLALLIIALIGPGIENAILAMAIVYSPNFTRLVRSETLSLRNRDFVSAALVAGGTHPQIVVQEILPNLMGNMFVYASLLASTGLIVESALSFLGLGVIPPTPSWGYMIAAGMQYWSSWWISFFPGLAIFFTVIGFNFLGDALRDALDPTQRRN
ncbi:Ni(2(+)) ABC transporter membrane subunit NikC [Hyphomicrobiales bacterium]|nr:Ni(2(+)) ABC transporter membrane subunit NikC [Hyphomicrobiales bacterium]CAH1691810.1 Ni(2(+)) ABC transporter membrane subunit NikC [Hyphomicrobiales bacterium]